MTTNRTMPEDPEDTQKPVGPFEDFESCVLHFEDDADIADPEALCGFLEHNTDKEAVREFDPKSDDILELVEALKQPQSDMVFNDLTVEYVSAVDTPAQDSGWVIAKDADGPNVRFDAPLVLSNHAAAEDDDEDNDDEDEDNDENDDGGGDQKAWAPVLVPNETDKQRDVIPPGVVEEAAHEFLAEYRQIDTDHDLVDGKGTPIESWTLKESRAFTKPNGEETREFPAGTWMLGVKFNDETWKRVQDGELTGFSIYGEAEKFAIDDIIGESKERDDINIAAEEVFYDLPNQHQEQLKSAGIEDSAAMQSLVSAVAKNVTGVTDDPHHSGAGEDPESAEEAKGSDTSMSDEDGEDSTEESTGETTKQVTKQSVIEFIASHFEGVDASTVEATLSDAGASFTGSVDMSALGALAGEEVEADTDSVVNAIESVAAESDEDDDDEDDEDEDEKSTSTSDTEGESTDKESEDDDASEKEASDDTESESSEKSTEEKVDALADAIEDLRDEVKSDGDTTDPDEAKDADGDDGDTEADIEEKVEDTIKDVFGIDGDADLSNEEVVRKNIHETVEKDDSPTEEEPTVTTEDVQEAVQ